MKIRTKISFFLLAYLLIGMDIVPVVDAIERKSIKVEVFSFPSPKTDLSVKPFHSVGVDYATGNIVFADDHIWCEIPYARRQFNFAGAFIGPVEEYSVKAVAGAFDDLYAYDVSSNQIVGGHKTFQLEKRIKHPEGMAYHKGFLYIAEGYKNMIYKIRLGQERAEEVQSYYAKQGITGLASDGQYLYASVRRKVLKFDDFFNVLAEYELDQSISGLTYVGEGEFVGASKTKMQFYRFSF